MMQCVFYIVRIKISSVSMFLLCPHIFSCFSSLLSFHVQAQAVTLTVAQAFKVALDLWEIAQEGVSKIYISEYFKGKKHP